MYVARQLGRYHLLDRIAYGGMAEIFRAKTFDSDGNEYMVAIKRVLAHLAEDDSFVQMLVDEAKIASLLDHPNIARVYEFARSGDEYFLALEYVDGKDLRSLIDRCRAGGVQIAPEHAAYIMACVLDALHAAHTRDDATGRPLDIVHRDVSPSNIIISYDGQVKLCDFGIAKATLSRVETRAGVVKGKVRYMSPEQTRGWRLDGRSDVFSAGAVLYEILTRQPAFSASSEMELVLRVREAKYAKLGRQSPNAPRELQRAIRRALTRSTNARYADAAQFAADLRAFLKHTMPEYASASLGHLLRRLFADDIEKDLRKLEEYVLGEPDPAALGDHLAGEPDHQHASYSRFTPLFREFPREDSGLRTRIVPRIPSPESRIPRNVSLHDAKTMLHDLEDSRRWVIKERAPSPDDEKGRDTARQTALPTEDEDEERGEEEKDESADKRLHYATTKILTPPE